MPSMTTSTTSEFFTSHSTYSWSACGNYDDQIGWVTCNTCGSTVADEYSYLEEWELETHKLRLCREGKAIRTAARALANLRKRTEYTTCPYCGHYGPNYLMCDCPF